jgi:hypothetical protein
LKHEEIEEVEVTQQAVQGHESDCETDVNPVLKGWAASGEWRDIWDQRRWARGDAVKIRQVRRGKGLFDTGDHVSVGILPPLCDFHCQSLTLQYNEILTYSISNG